MAQRAQKIALKPNKAQKELFRQHCGYARVAYNAAHSDFTVENTSVPTLELSESSSR